jgi:hypothetical protein
MSERGRLVSGVEAHFGCEIMESGGVFGRIGW